MLTPALQLIDLRANYVAAPEAQRKIMLVAMVSFALTATLSCYICCRQEPPKPPVIKIPPTKTNAYRYAALSKAVETNNSQDIQQLVGSSRLRRRQRDPDGNSL